jgi:hypothetical protein
MYTRIHQLWIGTLRSLLLILGRTLTINWNGFHALIKVKHHVNTSSHGVVHLEQFTEYTGITPSKTYRTHSFTVTFKVCDKTKIRVELYNDSEDVREKWNIHGSKMSDNLLQIFLLINKFEADYCYQHFDEMKMWFETIEEFTNLSLA